MTLTSCLCFLLVAQLEINHIAGSSIVRRDSDVRKGNSASESWSLDYHGFEVDASGGGVLVGAGNGKSTHSLFVVYSVGTGKSEAHVERMQEILNTWGKHLPSGHMLQLVGATPNASAGVTIVPAEQCPDDHSGGACKDAAGLEAAYRAGAKWAVLLGDDNFVLAANMEVALRRYDSDQPVLKGILGCGSCKGGGLCGGGGQIFSRAAMKQMGVESGAYVKEHAQEAQACGMWGDVANCRVASNHEVPLTDLEGLYGWKQSLSDLKNRVASGHPLIFHYMSAAKMHSLEPFVEQAGQASNASSPASLVADAMSKYLQDKAAYVFEENVRRSKLAA
eukprot:TRINITY_DN72154_c0_g1_i1.p1 TRINITY_DN72154_c0_g1~~TRINITY_DN72154_c0_g1_i1.p1  ORF type:complete len:335 (+),score=65.16 TRINITY_DN72154_c0_g1_i1:59-1063(+)